MQTTKHLPSPNITQLIANPSDKLFSFILQRATLVKNSKKLGNCCSIMNYNHKTVIAKFHFATLLKYERIVLIYGAYGWNKILFVYVSRRLFCLVVLLGQCNTEQSKGDMVSLPPLNKLVMS